MSDTTTRRRAPSATPEQRRAMIVAAALPLVAEHGTAVSTAQGARAAGLGEATIFRAFGDKDALVDACVAEALRPDSALDGIAAISLEQPLAQRLVDAADELDAYLTRMGTVIFALHATGRVAERTTPPDSTARTDTGQALVEAIAALLEPEAGWLRLPPAQLAAVFLTQLFGRRRAVPGSAPRAELTLEQTVEVFLHGALAEIAR